MNSLDFHELIDEAQQLGNQINHSQEVLLYLKLKQEVQTDQEAQLMMRTFEKIKAEFEETKRFGIFHPNYHEAKEKMANYQEKLNNHQLIGQFLQAEEQVEQLLYQISYLVARSISKEVKVPNGFTNRNRK